MLEHRPQRHAGALGDPRRGRAQVALVDELQQGVDDGRSGAKGAKSAAVATCVPASLPRVTGMSVHRRFGAMPDDILTLADKLWKGETDLEGHHPVSGQNLGDIAEVMDGVAFLPSFANVSAFTTGDGLVLVDTGQRAAGQDRARAGPVVDVRAPRHRRVLPRPHRPRLRRAGVRGGVVGQRLGAAAGASPTRRSPTASIATSSPPGTTA